MTPTVQGGQGRLGKMRARKRRPPVLPHPLQPLQPLHPLRLRRAWLLAAASWPAFGGCTEALPGTGAWAYVYLTLGVVGVGAYWLGRTVDRATRERAGSADRAVPNSPAAAVAPVVPSPPRGSSDRATVPVEPGLHAAFDALPQPCAIAVESTDGWRIRYLNLAAGDGWPGLKLGDDLQALHLGADLQPLEGSGSTTRTFAHGGQRGLLCTTRSAAEAARDAERLAEQEAAREIERESANFSFTVSHDLRAPIRVVEGFTRIVKEDYGRQLDRVGNDHLERVLGAAARMNQMIDALLTLARLSQQPLSRQPVNLSQLAGYVVDELRRSAVEREAEIVVQEGLTATGDPTLLRLVLENLLGNAWKYSQRHARAVISFGSVPHDGAVAYVVRDNGAGFDMRAADRLFGVFQRLHSASEFPGHGVGLASVRRIVRRHGGQVWAESEPGRGAAFYFTLAP